MSEGRQQPEVEAHRMYKASDEELKQAVQQLEQALDTLLEFDGTGEEDAEVEAHRMYRSDEKLKEAIRKVESALQALKSGSGATR